VGIVPTVSTLDSGAFILAKPDKPTYTSLDFLGWREQKALAVAPEFQRRSVWARPAKAYLIDTLLRGFPVPPLYLRVKQSKDKSKVIREVIDGQQRISAVLDYLDGKFSLLPSFDAPWAGREVSELSEAEHDRIRFYPFYCEVFSGISDAQVLEIFARLNTYSVPLNAQELRNGRYFGFFKQAAYELAHEYVEFWRLNRIFTERAIARMDDAELVSELMILQLDGLQDKKASITRFYSELDEEFPRRKLMMSRFQATLEAITEALDSVADTEFRRRPLFYSLFAAVYHRRYGLPKLKLATPETALRAQDNKRLRSVVAELSAVLAAAREDEPVPRNREAFVNASLRQTDNIQPRRVRAEQIYKDVF
jgi:Protein of unknown function DUF262